MEPYYLVVEIFMPFIIKLIAPGFNNNPEKFLLAVELSRLTLPFVLFVCITSLIGGYLNTLGKFAAMAFTPVILNLTMILLGYYIAKFFTTGIEQRKCISLECGLQNGTLAVFVATELFDDIIYLVPTAAYALIMFVTSIIFVLIIRKIN